MIVLPVEGLKPSPTSVCYRYDVKLHFVVKATVLDFWGVWSTPSLLLLSGSLCSAVVIPVRVPSRSQIDLFKNYSNSIGMCEKNKQKNLQLHKKCNINNEYESLTCRHKITLDELACR